MGKKYLNFDLGVGVAVSYHCSASYCGGKREAAAGAAVAGTAVAAVAAVAVAAAAAAAAAATVAAVAEAVVAETEVAEAAAAEAAAAEAEAAEAKAAAHLDPFSCIAPCEVSVCCRAHASGLCCVWGGRVCRRPQRFHLY